MPQLQVHSTPLPQGHGLTVQRVLHAVAHGTKGDYALLRGGESGWVLGVEPLCKVVVDAAGGAQVEGDEQVLRALPALPAGKPLEALQRVLEAVRFAQPHPLVGWMGFLSYDVGRFLERILPVKSGPQTTSKCLVAPSKRPWPTLIFTLYHHYIMIGINTQSTVAYTIGDEKTLDWEMLVRNSSSAHRVDGVGARLVERQLPTEYGRKIRRVKEYIAAGDIYQANLAQRWTVETPARPHEVFGRLCGISPAPYAACMRFREAGAAGVGGEERHIVSASPELFLEVREEEAETRTVVTRPIKGTRPRDRVDAARDAALREELLASAKDRAELTMIVDLLRNDLGRVAEFGSVRVEEARGLEAHPTVWHTVATIGARLRREVGLAELLAAVCPGGSITGAPKIRAMQIIEELEGFGRGVYCGNIGVIGDGGRTMLLNIAIRTMVFEEGRAEIFAGGGVVADSDPLQEYEETVHKARAMMEAVGIGEMTNEE